ncbi:hypothetical protein BHE90_002227 [Fusarium euwallaceae]|uniref:Ubiquitin 3 binding protein But2 C-terminal domain-containing protein n=1 Tax=Fusarium euwallaceae TaxID=1147111 RepID=A0A430M5F2_9HYPO|nr:hypothetical protein BHE90_002227 [Fusarium euwallaceae]
MFAKRLLSLAIGLLAADAVVAGPCIPLSSDTSSAVSSATSSASASSTTESLSSTESYSTTESASTTESLTLTSSSSESTPTTFFTTTTSSDSSTIETSTSAATTTTSTAPYNPIPTFKVVAVGGPVPGAELRSTGQTGNILTFNPTYSGTRVLSFSLEPSTGRLLESNGKYMCLYYGGGLSTVTVCNPESAGVKYLTCTVNTDLTLSCSGPEGHRYFDDEGEEVIYDTGATVDHFYVSYQGSGYYSYIGGANVVGGNFIPVKYGLQQVN